MVESTRVFGNIESPPDAPATQSYLPEDNNAAARRRVRLTGVGGVLLFLISWHWGSPEMARWSLVPGALLSMLGLAIRVWATGWLRKNEVLTTDGPYAVTRNPLYLGTLLIATGHSLMSGVPLAALLFPALCLGLYLSTIREEEEYLAARHGADFAAYRASVPVLLPRLWPRRSSAGARGDSGSAMQRFLWPRVRRCYKGFAANAAVILIYVTIHGAR